MTVVAVCAAPECKKEIAEGERLLSCFFGVTWGVSDLRDDWGGAETFCCFGCLSDWAAKRAEDHDATTLVEGVCERCGSDCTCQVAQ